jgi:hypothetical protein
MYVYIFELESSSQIKILDSNSHEHYLFGVAKSTCFFHFEHEVGVECALGSPLDKRREGLLHPSNY